MKVRHYVTVLSPRGLVSFKLMQLVSVGLKRHPWELLIYLALQKDSIPPTKATFSHSTGSIHPDFLHTTGVFVICYQELGVSVSRCHPHCGHTCLYYTVSGWNKNHVGWVMSCHVLCSLLAQVWVWPWGLSHFTQISPLGKCLPIRKDSRPKLKRAVWQWASPWWPDHCQALTDHLPSLLILRICLAFWVESQLDHVQSW